MPTNLEHFINPLSHISCVPIRTKVNVLVGSQAPSKFSPIMGRCYSFHFRIFENEGGKKIFFSEKKQKKKGFWILFLYHTLPPHGLTTSLLKVDWRCGFGYLRTEKFLPPLAPDCYHHIRHFPLCTSGATGKIEHAL